MDRRIKAAGAQNAYFPLLIPRVLPGEGGGTRRGFTPELAVVTHAGGKQLEEPLVVRPTSETVIGEYMAKWIQSYRDLPLLLNQWANVVRWELRPRLFLRTTEFLWQEGHTAHATEADAAGYARRIHTEVYGTAWRDVLAMPVVLGRKTAGNGSPAPPTRSPRGDDGGRQGLQMATSHELGQNFARAFDIKFTSTADSREPRVDHLVGQLHPHGRRRHHVPRRRQRAAATAGVAPVQVQVTVVKDTVEVADAARQLVDDLRESRRAGRAGRPGRHRLRSAGGGRRAQGHPGARRDRAPRPG